MAFPAGWARRVSVTGASPSVTLSGYVAVLTEVNLPTEIWATALNGGGDLRVALNSDGTSPLPLEVVSFDTSAQTAVLWVRFPTYSAAARECWLFYGKVGETQPSVTDPFGRNAVWADYEAVLHLNNTSWVDSTGNGYDATGTATVVSADNPFGDFWANFANISQPLTVPTGSNLNNSFLTVQAIVNRDGGDTGINDQGVVSNRFSTQGNNFYQLTQNTVRTTAIIHDGTGENTTAGPAVGIDNKWLAFTTSASNIINYQDGAQVAIDTSIAGDNQFVTNLNTRIGIYFDGSQQRLTVGKIGEVRIRKAALSADYISTEYDNQLSPATFWTTGTPEDNGGGGTITVNAATANYSYSPISATIDLTGEINITGATSSYAYNAITASVDLTGEITVTGATSNYSYTPVSAIIDLTGEITVTGATSNYSYTGISGAIDLTPEITITGSTANYNYTAQNGVVELGAAINVVGATSNYTYAAIDALVTLAGEIVVTADTATYSYNGIRGVVQIGEVAFNVNFNGYIKKSEFSGIIKQSAFFGERKQSAFAGERKQSQFIGVEK